VFQAPSSARPLQIKALAVSKMRYVMKKQ
jgi:hypothetical protein